MAGAARRSGRRRAPALAATQLGRRAHKLQRRALHACPGDMSSRQRPSGGQAGQHSGPAVSRRRAVAAGLGLCSSSCDHVQDASRKISRWVEGAAPSEDHLCCGMQAACCFPGFPSFIIAHLDTIYSSLQSRESPRTMEGALAAAAQCVADIVGAALATTVAQPECERISRYCVKVGGVLCELQLVLRDDEALRGESGRWRGLKALAGAPGGGRHERAGCTLGLAAAAGGSAGALPSWPPSSHLPPCRLRLPPPGSKTVFLAVDATVNALRQAEQLVVQASVGSGAGGRIPLQRYLPPPLRRSTPAGIPPSRPPPAARVALALFPPPPSPLCSARAPSPAASGPWSNSHPSLVTALQSCPHLPPPLACSAPAPSPAASGPWRMRWSSRRWLQSCSRRRQVRHRHGRRRAACGVRWAAGCLRTCSRGVQACAPTSHTCALPPARPPVPRRPGRAGQPAASGCGAGRSARVPPVHGPVLHRGGAVGWVVLPRASSRLHYTVVPPVHGPVLHRGGAVGWVGGQVGGWMGGCFLTHTPPTSRVQRGGKLGSCRVGAASVLSDPKHAEMLKCTPVPLHPEPELRACSERAA